MRDSFKIMMSKQISLDDGKSHERKDYFYMKKIKINESFQQSTALSFGI